MADIAAFDPRESVLMLGKSGKMVLCSDAAEVTIRGRNRLDKQVPDNGNKGKVAFKGKELTSLQCSWVLMPEDDATFWSDVFPLFSEPGKNGTANPLDIQHGASNRAGIAVVTVEGYDIGKADPVDGRDISVDLLEWTPRPTAPKKQSAARVPLTEQVPKVTAADAKANGLGGAA